MVGEGGIEPPRSLADHWILSPERLPFRHSPPRERSRRSVRLWLPKDAAQHARLNSILPRTNGGGDGIRTRESRFCKPLPWATWLRRLSASTLRQVRNYSRSTGCVFLPLLLQCCRSAVRMVNVPYCSNVPGNGVPGNRVPQEARRHLAHLPWTRRQEAW